MTVRYVLRPQANQYKLVAANVVSVKGDPGPPGPSGDPGQEVSEPYFTDDEHLAFDWVTHWGITADGEGYYAENPDSIPPGERGWMDWSTLTIYRGGPGRPDGPKPLNPRGEWQANTTYDVNDLLVYDGSFFRVAYPHRSAGAFDDSYLELLAGSPRPRGVGKYLAAEADLTFYADQAPEFIVFAQPLTRAQNVVLSRWRTPLRGDGPSVINATYTVTRQATATGSDLHVRTDAGDLIATLAPGQWVRAAYVDGAFTQVAGGPLL